MSDAETPIEYRCRCPFGYTGAMSEVELARRIHPQRVEGVLFTMAAEAEYGPALRQRFRPMFTGVGPVEAAVQTATELARRHGNDTMPEIVVCLGSAGSRTLAQTEVYQVASVSYRDIDASAIGFPAGQTPFTGLPIDVPLPYRIDGVPIATLSTGGDMVSGDRYLDIDAEMVDMETFGVLRACQQFGVPMIGLRGISDGSDELADVDDWTEYLGLIDERLATVVDRLLAEGATVADDFDERWVNLAGGYGSQPGSG